MDAMDKPIPWNSRLCHVVNLEMLSFYCRHLCVLCDTAAGQCFSWCISNLAFKAAQQHSESSHGVFRHHANWKSGQSLCKGQIYHHAWLYYYYSLFLADSFSCLLILLNLCSINQSSFIYIAPTKQFKCTSKLHKKGIPRPKNIYR